MSNLELVVRTAIALGAVVAAMWGLARLARRTGRAGRAGGTIQVLAGRSLSRGSSIGVVRVASKVLVVGTTAQSMTVLAELSAEEAAQLEPAMAGPTRPQRPTRQEGIIPGAPGELLRPVAWSRPGWGGRTTGPAGLVELVEWLREKSVRRT
ncbi:MAG: flagellar biosynthetic protein FliO [Actinomycetota bacterium]|nr:flagellar biosynthetic protein FliO [Actinomycetota bacterium]